MSYLKKKKKTQFREGQIRNNLIYLSTVKLKWTRTYGRIEAVLLLLTISILFNAKTTPFVLPWELKPSSPDNDVIQINITYLSLVLRQ